MIIDSSAAIAIIRNEPESKAFRTAIETSSSRRMSVVTYVETFIVLQASGDPIISGKLETLIRDGDIELVSVTPAQAAAACQAYSSFGKGSKSKAKLNFGDCFSYALAKTTGEPLLFKGKGFLHTDIFSAT